MRVLIVDDEPPARMRLARMVESIAGCEVAGEAGDGIAALELVPRATPDAVLLDVRMPRMDGLEAARHLAALPTPPAVIFTTAYDEYALAAFDAHAVAYLLKPVRADRLAAALAHARQPTRAQLDAMRAAAPRRHLAARIGDRLELVPAGTVSCFVADSKYVTARHSGGEVVLNETLKDLAQEFSDRFVRVHRNALVALDAVARIEPLPSGGALVHLRDGGAPVEASRRHVAGLRRRVRG